MTAPTRQLNLADLFEAVVDACPDRLALVAGDARLTYRQLDDRANRVAHHLLDRGVRAGEHVGILSWNRAAWVEAMIGCLKARAVPINVNYRYVEDELRYLFNNADLVALIHEGDFAERVATVVPDVPAVRHVLDIDGGYEDALADASPARDFGERSCDDRYVLFTGGTTGLPKGVVWRSEDIFFAAMGGGNFGGDPVRTADELGAAAAGRDALIWMVTAPLMHGGGQWVTFIALTTGGTVVLHCEHTFDPAEAWSTMERERVQSLMVVGDAMARPLAETLAAEPARWDTSSLVVVGSGGAILSDAVRRQLRAQLPNVLINDGFGASETGATGSATDSAGSGGGPRFRMGPHTKVLDDELRPVLPGSGQVGRLARSGHIPLGYYNDDEKTAATFFIDTSGTRWVIPGDMATVDDDGTIVVLGRGSGCINTGGEKVFPEEVEAALKAHPNVFDAVVVGVPDERWGEVVAAVVAPRPGQQLPTLEGLAEHCRTSLAGYKVPRRLTLVDEVPRTPVGKADTAWARRIAAGHATTGAPTR